MTSICSLQAGSVLLIIADDLGRDSLSAFNNDPAASLPPTPTIDSLAAQGIRFERTYAYATCSPTRASILTGRYGFRTGVIGPNEGEHTLQANEFTLPEAILASGAIGTRMAQLGKWHLGNETADIPNTIGGWPHFAGSLGGGLSSYNRWTKVINGVSTSRYTTYATTDIVNDAVTWITEQGSDDWFLWVAFNAPHTPFHKPDNDLHDYDSLDGTNEDIEANPRPYYEAMVQAMDTEIERLLQSVDLNNTTVIFIGDNGSPGTVVQSPFSTRHAKGSLYEGGVNVPMIIAGEAVANNLHNTVSNEIINTVDLYKTVLDLFAIDANSILPSELVFDSQSFHPLLTGASSVHTREIAYSRSPSSGANPGAIIVNSKYKWINYADRSDEFYALSDGLSETNDRLTGTLDSNESAALTDFTTELESLQNVPQIHAVYLDNDNQFTAEVGWFANANLTLQKSTELTEDSWQPVANFTITDDGSNVYYVKDDAALSTNGFYRVSSE
ncbi:sulfatase-like hydrolase/transferase [Rubellicoccus peritrichatus]|uniref:Sulfatase-like hydrolase/transferase n=1 Tax=Rubellicoccus peritrichatus TaxID=3080537 RepID=A0AAQ3L5Z0_9BACT|nr:sulfatase-like hydrolase/transferase [Puniceicoccus sp. CR14]WOO39387.1 sulfatase-like hydrolase/transferase [Puniceicoccus sp. CR14]